VRAFGELEAVIMERMWSDGHPAAVRDVLAELQRRRTIAYTTVMTVMDKLHQKGWLRREMVGRAYVYEPVCTREEYSARLMREALAGSKDEAATLVHFVETMSAAETQALRKALEQSRPAATRPDRPR